MDLEIQLHIEIFKNIEEQNVFMRFLVLWGTAPKAWGFFYTTALHIRNHTNTCPWLVLPWLPTVLPES